jgi:hypothetical protein
MVGVKIACKDATKIPSKRLFEMMNSLYVIQFKVEKDDTMGSGGEDEDNGRGNDDGGNEDDNGMEELDHETVNGGKGEDKGASTEKSSSKVSYQKGSASCGRKVATWASLFQVEDENMTLEWSELGQYSCTKLLSEMEALEAKDEEECMMKMDDEELVSIPEGWTENLGKTSMNLPDDIMSIPEMSEVLNDQSNTLQAETTAVEDQKRCKAKWGLVLVEKIPSRTEKDGRSILEKV